MNAPTQPTALPTALPDVSATFSASGCVRLNDWGLIRAAGDEAAKFLHGQLTQDIEHLAAGRAVLAGYCSPKGRLLASFVVWRPAPDEVLLACSADVLAPVLKRLQMFVMRARCKLTDATTEWPLWGAVGASAGPADAAVGSHVLDGGMHRVRLADAVIDGQAIVRWLVAGQQADAMAQALPALDASIWLALEAASGVPRVTAATSEQFVPQMVNLELVGGVNFQKGCYPGQEVVARSQYRGSIKRRAQMLHSAADMRAGQEVFSSADPDQPAGMVVLGGSLAPGNHVALAELKLAALESGSLHVGSATGPVVTLGALPYAIPTEPA